MKLYVNTRVTVTEREQAELTADRDAFREFQERVAEIEPIRVPSTQSLTEGETGSVEIDTESLFIFDNQTEELVATTAAGPDDERIPPSPSAE